MLKWLRNYLGYGEDDLVNNDEVLVALKHRSAFRAFKLISVALIVTAAVLQLMRVAGEWKVVGLTLFVVFFCMVLVYEVLLAYEGVYKGRDELISRLRLKRATVVRKSILNGIFMGAYMFCFLLLPTKELGISWSVGEAVVIAAVFAWLHYSRYRKFIA